MLSTLVSTWKSDDSSPQDAINSLVSTLHECINEVATKKIVTAHSKPWIDSNASRCIKKLRLAKKLYIRRRSSLNSHRLELARQEASDALNLARNKWLVSECNKIPKVGEKEKWNIINKLTSTSRSTTVQPIEVTGTNNYVFSDEEIRALMEEYHISKGLDASLLINEVKEVQQKIADGHISSSVQVSEASSRLMNSPISESEIDFSFGSSDGSPGPDGVSAKWIDCADREVMTECLLYIFNNLWILGHFHSDWKKEIRAILSKLGRTSYHHCDSYRTISLTNVIGKRFEKITCRRLVAILEDQDFDIHQYAYLKERSATQAISLFNQTVSSAMESGKECGAIFFDFRDAFGMVNRSILIRKLACDFGISGNLLSHICDFLSDRKANLKISGELGEWIPSVLGTSAGTIYGPILFVVLVHDAPTWLNPKFADDLNGIAICDTVPQVECKLQNYAVDMKRWATQNEIPLNVPKCKVMLFGHTDKRICIVMDNVKIKQVIEHKLLGVWIDNMMKFELHAERACAKGRASLMKISSLLLGRAGISVTVGIQIYTALIRSLFEYAIPSWIFKGISFLNLFQALQYQCLRSICGAFNKSSAAALEVISAIQPIDLRFQDLSMREWVRLMSLDIHHPLYSKLFESETCNTPLGYLSHICHSFHNDLANKGCQIMQRHVISPAAIANQRKFVALNLFENADIGRSGERSLAHKELAKAVMEQFISENLCTETALVFCDGSSTKGKCGSAAITLSAFGEFPAARNVLSLGDNVEAEVDGILLSFESVLSLAERHSQIKRCIIISDCESALKIVLSQADVPRWEIYFKKIWEVDNSLRHLGIEVFLAWCPSHCGIPLNEKVDTAAKQACFMPNPLNQIVDVSLEQCKTLIAERIKRKWQVRWNQSPSGGATRDIIPTVGTKIDLSPNRSCGVSMVRSLLNNAAVNDVLFRFHLVDSPDCPDCDRGRQTVDHILLHCTKFALPRRVLRLSLPINFNFSVPELLNPSFCSSKKQRKDFYELVHTYFDNISI